jgi:DNA-binding LytR/AlgR family response regulator
MNSSSNTNGSSDKARRGSVRLEAGLFAGLLALAVLAGGYQPTPAPMAWQGELLRVATHDRAEYALPGTDDQAWPEQEVADIRALDDTIWLRTEVILQSGSNPIPPYALFLSGPFSAEAWWDGQLLGAKGQVAGLPAQPEVPGPIDAVLYIPEALSTPGTHTLALRVSSREVGYRPQTLIHRLAIGTYHADPRRQLRYYALPMILSGGFLLLVLQFARIYHATGSTTALALAVMALMVLLQLACEVSRSVVAYSYDWHFWRSLGIWLFACGAGLALNTLVYARTGKQYAWWLPALVVVVLGASYYVSGFDLKAVWAIRGFALAPLVAGLVSLRREQPDLILLAAGLLGLAWLVVSWFTPSVLLDSTFYFTAITFLAAVWFWITRGNEAVDSVPDTRSAPEHFFIQHTGRSERLPADQVLYLRAAGNYTELVCEDGRTVLHHLRLGQIMEKPPRGFLRVHRSHAINLARTTGLRSLEGSRYFAQLGGEHEVPVSRYQARDVRALLR